MAYTIELNVREIEQIAFNAVKMKSISSYKL